MKRHQPAKGHEPPLSEFLCFAIYSTNHALTRVYKPLLDPLGLTYPQYIAMVALWEGDDRTVGALGEALALESSTLTPLLKRLESAGLIERKRDAADERQVRVRLTAAGAGLREKARHVQGCLLEASGLTLDQGLRLHRDIVALRDGLNRSAARTRSAE